jgi:hypothetical protein
MLTPSQTQEQVRHLTNNMFLLNNFVQQDLRLWRLYYLNGVVVGTPKYIHHRTVHDFCQSIQLNVHCARRQSEQIRYLQLMILLQLKNEVIEMSLAIQPS